MKLKNLFHQKGAIVTKMRALLDTAEAAKRGMTADESVTFSAMEKDLDAVVASISREQTVASAEASVSGFRDGSYRPGVAPAGAEAPKTGRASAAYNDAFMNGLCRRGRNGLTTEHTNALQEGTDSEGGFLVPQEFETAIYGILNVIDPIRAAATVIQTASDRNIPIEADAGSFAYIGEEGGYGVAGDPAFGREILKAWKFGGIVKVSEELLQDAAFALEPYLRGLAARRTGNLEGVSFATGNGTSAPLGLFIAAAVAGVNLGVVTGAVSATPAITGDDVIDLFHKLPVSYRARASFVAGDGLVKLVRKLKSTDNQYLWQPGLAAGSPDMLMGRPLLISEGGPAPLAAAKTLVFGDLKTYVIADRLGIAMQRLNELFAANGQIGFKFTGRHDARLTDPKALVQFKHGAAA